MGNDTKLREAAALGKTPLYVFDLGELSRRISFLRNQLPASVSLCFAVKANPFLLREISELVERLEVCSPGELRICRKLGLPPEKFVISGVYKTPSLIHELLAEGDAGEIYTVESMGQFALLYTQAQNTGKRISVLLRLTSGNQFGMDEAEVEHLVTKYHWNPYLDIRGIQFFSGTQKNSLKRLKRELDYLDSFLGRIQTACGFQAKELEYGPGLPTAYFQGDSFDEVSFLSEFSKLLTGMRFRGHVTLEIGRSMVASCGSYLTRVVDVKSSCGQNYAIVDGGIHHLVYYGQSMAMKQPKVRLLPPFLADKTEAWNIFGSLCTINDVLVKRLSMPRPRLGDILVFEKAGAYCMTEGISLFLSRELPAVILIREDGTLVLARDHIPVEHLNTPNNETR